MPAMRFPRGTVWVSVRLALLVVLGLNHHTAVATVYHIDPDAGHDANSGSSSNATRASLPPATAAGRVTTPSRRPGTPVAPPI